VLLELRRIFLEAGSYTSAQYVHPRGGGWMRVPSGFRAGGRFAGREHGFKL